MTYRGVSKKEALDTLTTRVKDDLSKAGLGGVYYKAEDVVGTGGIPAVTETRKIPDDTSPEMVMKAHEIIGRHVGELFKERYGL
ncbi:MAG: hypothetical protein ABSA81_03040 [Candidatus Bathyarchaeia archaeon]